MQLGSVAVQSTTARREQLVMLLWGKPSSGKTVLASTAPGRKLFLQFDPAGTASLKRSPLVTVADFSAYSAAKLADLKQGGMVERDLLRMLQGDDAPDTVVVDSVTSFAQLALTYAVVSGKANKGTFKATLEAPGMTGYGVRTAMVLDFCSMVLRCCLDTGRHCIFICHEQERTDEEGRVSEITIALSGQTASVLPAKISELWRVDDVGKQRLVYVRNHALWRPMRTRMFAPGNATNFQWRWDQEAGGDTHTIAAWYDAWAANGFDKVPLPVG